MTKQLHEELIGKANIANSLQDSIRSSTNSIKLFDCKIRKLIIEIKYEQGISQYIEIPVEIQDQFIEVTKRLLTYQLKNTEKKYDAL